MQYGGFGVDKEIYENSFAKISINADHIHISYKNKWKKVSNEKPIFDGNPVMVYQTFPQDTIFNCAAYPLNRCFHKIAEYRFGEFVGEDSKPIPDVTHWMYLPEKPENEING